MLYHVGALLSVYFLGTKHFRGVDVGHHSILNNITTTAEISELLSPQLFSKPQLLYSVPPMAEAFCECSHDIQSGRTPDVTRWEAALKEKMMNAEYDWVSIIQASLQY